MSSIPEYKKESRPSNNPARNSDKNRNNKRYSESSLLPLGIIIGVVFFLLTGYWLGNNMSADALLKHENSELRTDNTLMAAENTELQRENNVLANRLQEREDKLTFYETLPKQQVAPTRQAHKLQDNQPHHPPPPKHINDIIRAQLQTSPSNNNKEKQKHAQQQYRVQLASFKQRSDAEVLRSKLAKKHIQTRIVSIKLADKGMRFRILAGPYASRNAARAAKKRIAKESDFDGIVLKYE